MLQYQLYILVACNTMYIFTHAFAAEAFQQMSAALTFQIGLNVCAQVIRLKYIFFNYPPYKFKTADQQPFKAERSSFAADL